jgi:cytochrome c553
VKPSAAATGKAPKQVAACVACHGETGLGVEAPLTPKPAVLAGQHVDYLEQALDAYRNGRRQNAVMDSMAKLLLSEEDVKIAASYFANQSSPLVTAKTDSK